MRGPGVAAGCAALLCVLCCLLAVAPPRAEAGSFRVTSRKGEHPHSGTRSGNSRGRPLGRPAGRPSAASLLAARKARKGEGLLDKRRSAGSDDSVQLADRDYAFLMSGGGYGGAQESMPWNDPYYNNQRYQAPPAPAPTSAPDYEDEEYYYEYSEEGEEGRARQRRKVAYP